jgi:hypothetical protein
MALLEIPGRPAREMENKVRVGMAGNEILGERFIVRSDENSLPSSNVSGH